MKPISLADAAVWSGGDLMQGSAERFMTRVCSDTRTLQPGDLFVALRGEHFDGHDYATEAAQKGAIAMMCDRDFTSTDVPAALGLIRVEDTLKGLQKLAGTYRKQLDLRVVGITGSNGKTSTKEMVAAALSVKYQVQKTQGNLNNHIGVPLTLLALEEQTEWAVIEMGMNHPGEIRPLAAMGDPDIAVVTGIGWVHIEAFDSREGIAEEKGELIRALKPEGVAVINGDDPLLVPVTQWTDAKIIRTGFGDQNNFRVTDVTANESGTQFSVCQGGGNRVAVSIPLFGAHMASNAALALAVAAECGVPLESAANGLKNLELPGGRLKLHAHAAGWLLDDTYNASPDSMVAGMDSLALLPGSGRKVALLGSMGELGAFSQELHEWVGEQAAKRQFDLLGAIGPFAEAYIKGARDAGMDQSRLMAASTHEQMIQFYQQQAEPNDVILVKGSRSMAMEKVVGLIQEKRN
jgi:UDP-N-acetylmuramoyl-tripeptide--D-alanyl-D-alanine ligase